MLVGETITAPKGDISVGLGDIIHPQGGVLSALLWNLVVDKVLDEIKGQGCKLVGTSWWSNDYRQRLKPEYSNRIHFGNSKRTRDQVREDWPINQPKEDLS